MAFVQLKNIGISFADRCIFRNAQLTVSSGKCIALAGSNGSGKSTLMKIIVGIMEPDEGHVSQSKGTRITYLPQSEIITSHKTVREEALEAFRDLEKLHNLSVQLTHEMSENPSDALIKRYENITEKLERSDWDKRESKVHRVLEGLGFKRKDFERMAGEFSAGWQMRIALARTLLHMPEILLMDEPTNYLDLEAREWLEKFICNFEGGVLLVSHDRSFLENTCSSVAELRHTKLRIFHGKYSAYEKQCTDELKDTERRWKEQKREIARIELFINRFRYKDSKAKQVQSRVKMLDKMERIEMPDHLQTIQFSFISVGGSSKIPLRCENLKRQFGNKTVFSNVNLEFLQGSRTAVVGPNGAGKTTLLRIIANQDKNYEGKLLWGKETKIGYFSVDEPLNPNHNASIFNASIFEEASRNCNQNENQIRNLLGAFMFRGNDIHKKVSVLSGGENSRLKLVKILLQPLNFLILDEPTNHLDIHSKDILLNALEHFPGTLVIVSHDRYFLDRIAEQIAAVEHGQVQLHLGSYKHYRERKERETDKKAETRADRADQKEPSSPPSPTQEEHKRRRRLIAKTQKEEQKLIEQIETNENQAAKLRATLELPENYSNPQKARQLSQELESTEKKIRKLNGEWEETAKTLETCLEINPTT